MKKGQGAFEYIMTYGWAIIIVIIVGIILWNSGLFGQASEGTSGFNKIRPADYQFGTTGTNSVIVWDNVAGQALRNVNITYDGDNSGTYDVQGYTGSVRAGKRVTDTVNITSLSCSAGDSAVVPVQISYKSEAGVTRTETGTIRGTCA